MENINLTDCNGSIVSIGDVVKRLNIESNETTYFIYTQATDYGKSHLFHLSKNGDIEKNSFQHIPVDLSVSLSNNEQIKWYRVGKRNELNNDIFK